MTTQSGGPPVASAPTFSETSMVPSAMYLTSSVAGCVALGLVFFRKQSVHLKHPIAAKPAGMAAHFTP